VRIIDLGEKEQGREEEQPASCRRGQSTSHECRKFIKSLIRPYKGSFL
jgi:hypothetical protein